jgi:hypothetical protein
MSGSRLWYVKRADGAAGPYPAAQIKRAVCLGRLGPNDLLSEDAEHWRPLRDFPVFHDPAQPPASERQKILADERVAERRHLKRDPNAPEARRGPDRRKPESQEVLAARAQRNQIYESVKPHADRSRPVILATVLALIALVGAAAWLSRPGAGNRAAAVDCMAPVGPGVHWDGCNLAGKNLEAADLRNAQLAYADLSVANLVYGNLDGARLTGITARGADLRFARLTNADLSHADLRDANLRGADLTGTRLGGALWMDGSRCAKNSVGACLSSGAGAPE